ncbi:MAG TPA: PQQ-dependent sugar dehydrogenase [Verrucomicrobiae bacterium]|nr:PQQ-dependent sugar dehydrogenase [Verrucomicrobiae bacterium]
MRACCLILLLCVFFAGPAAAAPSLNDPNLRVEEVVSGLASPTTMAFIADGDILVLQKNDGRVIRILNGVVQSPEVLDLNVDSAVAHGLLGIALHPDFATNGFIYLYYTQASGAGDSDDGSAAANVVRKFHWDGSALTAVAGDPILSLPVTPDPNHNGGIILFGPDGKLYVINGDLNRDGQLQNFSDGPAPDGTSVIHRLNDDGTVPDDNPFAALGDPMNKYFAYGIRNSFGMAVDPVTGKLWDTENGENTYDEINLVEPGFNSGWQSIMGPATRPENVGHSPYIIPGSNANYADPKFSWFDTVGPTAIIFLSSAKLGAEYENDVFVGDINNGNLYHFEPNANRDGFILSGDLSDLVADSAAELPPVIFATGFDGVTDLKVGPDGLLYVVSFGAGAIYRIGPRPLAVGAASFPDAEIGVPYEVDLNINGGTDPYTIQSPPIKGALPLGIAPNGTHLSGTPSTAKKFKFTLRVVDDSGTSVDKQFSIQVFKALMISTHALKSGKVGKSYKAALKAKGGKAPYAWTVKSGSTLPSPLTLAPGGQIIGVPPAVWSGDVTFQVSDNLGVSREVTLTLSIN